MPRVMIVEDDVTILSNLSQILQMSGLDVIEAHDGRMAYKLLQASKTEKSLAPKMIVSDLMMPHMDGFDLLKGVRNDALYNSLPFVLLSARSDASDLQQAFALGANDYLIKPFEVEHLIDVIRHHLAKDIDQEKKASGSADCVVNTGFFLE